MCFLPSLLTYKYFSNLIFINNIEFTLLKNQLNIEYNDLKIDKTSYLC